MPAAIPAAVVWLLVASFATGIGSDLSFLDIRAALQQLAFPGTAPSPASYARLQRMLSHMLVDVPLTLKAPVMTLLVTLLVMF